ncbi:MAG: hypothetical protein JRI55_40690, partial [Deltaproteobacteria bacterium]|nr:hypothetical protein [Deltaproteobacteria bacterium]
LAGGADHAIIAGDWNLALEVYWARTLLISGEADTVWGDHVGCVGCELRDLDPRDLFDVRYNTTSSVPSWLDNLGLPVAIDHVVVSPGVAGACTIHDTGGDPATEPLDTAYPGLGDLGPDRRIDHFAISCELEVQPAG